MPRSILGSLAMARDSAMAGDPRVGLPNLEEADRDLAQADLVAVGESRPPDALAVDDDAVQAAVVEHDHDLAASGDDGVAPRYGQVLEHDVGRGGTAEAEGPGADADDDELLAVLDRQVAAGGEPRNGERTAAVAVSGEREMVGGPRRGVGGRRENVGHGGQSPGRIQALPKRPHRTS